MSTAHRHRVLLVTGTLAEPAMRRVAAELKEESRIDPIVAVLKIQVAALMTTEWVAKKLELPEGKDKVDRIVLPGYCRGDLNPIEAKFGVPVERGPSNLHDLPEYFGREREAASGYGAFDIEIIAEINHAARLPLEQIIALAQAHRDDGAEVIDIGCDPLPPEGERPAWEGVAVVVRELRARGLRVSVDSLHSREIELAAAAGAELVLSVNSTNREAASGWIKPDGMPIEVVAIPDTPQDLDSLEATIEHLAHRGIPFRIDPIIEPIGFGFAQSLGRYLEARRRWPDVAMMMGVGNLTEMTEVDSAGVNALLIGFCQELGIRSVLTTQVINWSRSAVKEIDVARKLMHFAVTRRTPPKHVDSRLVALRDPKLRPLSEAELNELASKLTDRNIRIFVDEQGKLHAMNKDNHAVGDDPYLLFDELRIEDPSHAFYLGYEMAKAITAATLGKNYVQDEPLRWGLHTREEISHHERRKGSRGQGTGDRGQETGEK
ncbi:MAG: DUF6513 domain-containing protein [Phycisphaeraceae bacterium]